MALLGNHISWLTYHLWITNIQYLLVIAKTWCAVFFGWRCQSLLNVIVIHLGKCNRINYLTILTDLINNELPAPIVPFWFILSFILISGFIYYALYIYIYQSPSFLKHCYSIWLCTRLTLLLDWLHDISAFRPQKVPIPRTVRNRDERHFAATFHRKWTQRNKYHSNGCYILFLWQAYQLISVLRK